MIWGAISWEHKSALHYFDSTVTADSYLNEVLLPLGLPFARASVLDFIWMDDNVPPHRFHAGGGSPLHGVATEQPRPESN